MIMSAGSAVCRGRWALLLTVAVANMAGVHAFILGKISVFVPNTRVSLHAHPYQATFSCRRRSRSWSGQLRANAGRDASDLENMRAAEIKQELFKRGISYAGLFEKSELVQKLAAALAEDAQSWETESGLAEQLCQMGGFRVPLSRLMAREGTLGSDVRIDEKDYYAVRCRFPDLKSETEADFILDTAASNSVITPQWSRNTGATPTGLLSLIACHKYSSVLKLPAPGQIPRTPTFLPLTFPVQVLRRVSAEGQQAVR